MRIWLVSCRHIILRRWATLDQDATLVETIKRGALYRNKGYKAFDRHRVKTNQEWAEVCFIPAAIGYSRNTPRYMAIREVMGSMELQGMESPQQSFPFHTFQVSSQSYKLFGLVTNMDWAGEALIHWHRERFGKSEEVHLVMKEDLAGGKLPSYDFGENAAWWPACAVHADRWIMILAINLNSAMKRLVLGKTWAPRRMKAIRVSFINIPGRIIERSCELIIRLVKGHPAMDLFLEARSRIMALAPFPSG